MARSTSTIKAAITTEKNTKAVLQPILFAEEGGSRVGVLNTMADVVAVNINIHEQMFDSYKEDIEKIALNAVPGTENWLSQKIKEFQYSADSPQYIEFTDFVPAYTLVDESLRIITRAAVISLGNGRITVKAAKSEPPVKLLSAEKTALQQYLDNIVPAGPFVTVISEDADRIYVDADVYYDGQYIDSIQATVEAALSDYLAAIPFDGVVLLSKLQDAIQGVAGVKDVVINEVRARKAATAFGSATTLTRQWVTDAGYALEENESGNTWSDTINYIVE
jgi:hypothetical protein